MITEPKTEKSNRTIKMPQFLWAEMQDYIKSLYSVEPNDRIFQITKYYLYVAQSRLEDSVNFPLDYRTASNFF